MLIVPKLIQNMLKMMLIVPMLIQIVPMLIQVVPLLIQTVPMLMLMLMLKNVW